MRGAGRLSRRAAERTTDSIFVRQSLASGRGCLRLATQVQARTQQLTASEGQRGHLLVRTHGPNLAAGHRARQENGPEDEANDAIVLLIGCCLAAVAATFAQDFKVLWSTLGEVVSAGKDAVPIQRGAKVVRVDVQPSILPVALGKQVCISALQVHAFGADGRRSPARR